jgi:hypothetical protein
LTLPAERRASVLYAGLLAAVMVALLAAQLRAQEYTQFFIDFKVPYCAAQVMLQGTDPYRFGALTVCEHTVAVPPYVPALRAIDPTLEPPPIPPYEMLPFLALARLPFAAALALWMAANIGGCALAADMLRRALPTLHPALIGTTVVVSALPVGLDLGQFTGIVLFGVTGLGLALRDRKPLTLAASLALVSLQPHVAIPAACALLFRPAGRLAVACVAAAIGLVSALLFGGLTLEWLTTVLPGAAAINLIDAGQVSYVSLAATLGAPLGPTLQASRAIYAGAIALGALAGARIAARSGRLEALPWIAVAIGGLGAPYLHLQQVTLFLPAALLLIEIGPSRRWALVAAYGLAVPWSELVMQSWGPLFALGAAAAAWQRPTPRRLLAVAGTAALLLAIATGAAYAFTVLRGPGPLLAPPVAPGEDAWAAFIVQQGRVYGVATLAARALTWAAGLLLVMLAATAAFGPGSLTALAAGGAREATRPFLRPR